MVTPSHDIMGGVVAPSAVRHVLEQDSCRIDFDNVELSLPRSNLEVKILVVNNDLRGVASCGLRLVLVQFRRLACGMYHVPLIDMEVLRQIGGQTRSRRRASSRSRLEREIIRLGFLHAQVPEVEIGPSKTASIRVSRAYIGDVPSKASPRPRRWLHGS